MAMVPGSQDHGDEDDLVSGGSARADERDESGPLVCVVKGLGDAFAGAIMGSVFGFAFSLLSNDLSRVAIRRKQLLRLGTLGLFLRGLSVGFSVWISSLGNPGSGLFKKQGFKVALREGGSSAKTFALLSGVHSAVSCFLQRIRGVEDALNAGIAGCATGLVLSTPGTPQTLLQSCVSFGVFSYILETFSKTRKAVAVPLHQSARKIAQEHNFVDSMQAPVLPPFSLPPPMFAGPFALFSSGNFQQRHVGHLASFKERS